MANPTGNLYLYADGNQIGYTSLDGSGNPLVVSTPNLSLGAHTLTAQYGGDSNFDPANASLSYNIVSGSGKAQATVAIVASPANQQIQGQAVTFTVTVTPA